MNDGQLSSTMKAMIEAAKTDAPSAAARAKVWTQVSGAVGAGAAGAAGGAGLAGIGSAGAGAAKLLVVGAIFGGAMTVGLAVTMLRIRNAPAEPRGAAGPAIVAIAPAAEPPLAVQRPGTSAVSVTNGANAAPVPADPVALDSLPVAAPVTASGGALPQAVAPSPAAAHAKAPVDPLAREAQLVSEARGALGRGDARRALQAVRAARALPSHQLAPEELAVESQALRALGRAGDADEADETLRSKFPESALAR